MVKNDVEKRNILLCVAGMTPQIITETLFALHTNGERIDEIRIITTLEGRNKVLQHLLHQETGKFYEFCRDFGLDAAKIKFDETTIALLGKPDGTTLEDIRTPEENALAGNRICEIVAELCRDENTRIHASAAGGRKTMSIYLTAAMQLFGRSDDSLSHVLVSEEFESNTQFFYPPPDSFKLSLRDGQEVSTGSAKIYLAPIPFIRLQGARTALTLQKGQNYSDLVKQAQNYLDTEEKDYPLIIDLQTNQLSVGKMSAKISAYEILLYLIFAERKLNAEVTSADGFIPINLLEGEEFERAFQTIILARQGEICPLTKERLENTEWEFLLQIIAQADSKNDKDYTDFMNSVIRAVGRANKKIRKAGFPPKYEIISKGSSRPKKYGLDLARNLISIKKAQVK